jgi:hypothetical protein
MAKVETIGEHIARAERATHGYGSLRKVVALPTLDPVRKLNAIDGDELRKIGHVPTLAKALGDMADAMREIAARLKTVEDVPLPMGTSSVRVVSKTDDNKDGGAEKILDDLLGKRGTP